MKQADVLERMDRYLAQWREADDARHVFLSCYRMMTARMLLAIDERAFQDPEWVRELLEHFANYYFDAVECYECGRDVPEVWRQVHHLTCQDRLHRIQSLLLGVNAHINYDLVLTLYDMLQPEWSELSPVRREERYLDHCKVNEIIASTIDAVQDEILSPADPLMKWIDIGMGRIDEYLISRLISDWRQDVWAEAQQMLLTSGAEERERLRRLVEAGVMRRSDYLQRGFSGLS